MVHAGRLWWERVRVHHKVLAVLMLLLGPLFTTLIVLLSLIGQLLGIQDHRQDLMSVREEVRELRRLAINIEDAFRGFLLTEQDKFLTPLREAELRLPAVIAQTNALLSAQRDLTSEVTIIERRISDLLRSKQDLIAQIHAGTIDRVHQFVREGRGLEMSDALRADLRRLEDRLDAEIKSANSQAVGVSERAYWSVLLAVGGTLALGWIGSRMLARSITEPLAILQRVARSVGRKDSDRESEVLPSSEIRSRDEIGQLARSYEDMNRRICQYIEELETLQTIGQEINTIEPDGIDGVLRKISNRAVELIHADICLVLLRDERMGCWVIEAASGHWNDRLRKTVLLWEEFPICVRAFETGKPAAGARLRADRRPELTRRNLIGDSMLSVPLLAQGNGFGVLVLLSEAYVQPDSWNDRLALGLAQAAAVAISNARLYEVVREKGKGLRARLQQLEHMAEMLAHDLKGPGQRMEQLAAILQRQYAAELDARATKWLRMLEENGRDLTGRVEGILALARVGARQESVQAVDPSAVIQEVLKSRAGELEALQAKVHVQSQLPLVACQGDYLRQIFDNLLSNALKFVRPGVVPEIWIEGMRKAEMVLWTFRDNGVGIPSSSRDRVFVPFVRLDPSASGSGIGLTIVQRIVQLYRGTIWIDEPSGPGTIFRFTLPILEHWEEPPSEVTTMCTTAPEQLWTEQDPHRQQRGNP